MKVMCIDASESKSGNKSKHLKEGNVYTKIQEVICPAGILHYELLGVDDFYCGAFRFIPLSNIDETEIHKETLCTTSNPK